MQNLLTHRTVSLTELRDPRKVISEAGGEPVAILNRNKVEGYFVPASAVEKLTFEPASEAEVAAVLAKRKGILDPTVAYLKDK